MAKKFIKLDMASDMYGLSVRQLRRLCLSGQIKRASKCCGEWPANIIVLYYKYLPLERSFLWARK